MSETRSDLTPRTARSAPSSGAGPRATIGRSITIKGEVTGDEDLLIQGQVDGSVDLKQHALTVGPEGEVKADVTGRVVTVEGTVEGNLHAEEQVILRGSAKVRGDIKAPRVVIEDGARFRGGVDMGEPVRRGDGASTSGSPRGAGSTERGSGPTGTAGAPRGADAGTSTKTSDGTSVGKEKRTAEAGK